MNLAATADTSRQNEQQARSPRLLARARRVGMIASAVPLVIGLGALVAHLLGVYPYSFLPDLGFAVPNCAASLCLLGLAVLLQTVRGVRHGGPAAWLGEACALVSALLMGATLAEHATRTDLGLAEILASPTFDASGATVDFQPGHGATLTLLALSGSVLLLRTRSLALLYVSTVCTVVGMLMTVTVLLAYGFGVSDASPFWDFLSMAAVTAVGCGGLCVGVLMARPDRPAARNILAAQWGGVMARRLLVVCVGAPLGAALLHYVGVRWYLLDQTAGIAVLTAFMILVLCLMVHLTAVALNRSDRRRSAAEARQARMVDELDHRVKNNLATVLALFEQTAAGSTSIESLRESFRVRLAAMARVHEALARQRWEGVDLSQMVGAVVGPFAGEHRLESKGPGVMLPAEAALPVAATLLELATNAAKHGSLKAGALAGRVEIQWRLDGQDRVLIDWLERGGPQVALPERRGLGITLIEGMIRHELAGSADLKMNPLGVECRLSVPLRDQRNQTGPTPARHAGTAANAPAGG